VDTQNEDLVVAVNIPSHDMMHAGTAGDLARMMAYTAAHYVPENGITALLVNQVSGTLISDARNELARGALEQGVDYMLWVDSDMRFPRDALVRLLVHEKAMVGVNYSNRNIKAPNYSAIKSIRTGDSPGARLETTEESTGLEEVEGIGFGLVLTHAGIFDRLGPGPWFRFGWDEEIERQIGEDIWFSKAVHEIAEIWVDHDLSKEVRHAALMELTPEHVEQRYELMRELADASDSGLHDAPNDDSDVAQ
jgi:hypothetical protein